MKEISLKLKNTVHQMCLEKVSHNLEQVKNALLEIQEYAESEDKNSAGDKHETGQAMAHLEREKLSPRYEELKSQLGILNSLDPTVKHKAAGKGSLIRTDKSILYIAVSLGKIQFDQQDIFVISPSSPVAEQLNGKKEGESYTFNSISFTMIKLI